MKVKLIYKNDEEEFTHIDIPSFTLFLPKYESNTKFGLSDLSIFNVPTIIRTEFQLRKFVEPEEQSDQLFLFQEITEYIEV